MRLSRRSIRTKIIALLAVPLVGLVGVWAFATVQTVGPVSTLLESQTRFTDGTVPATGLVAQLQAERRIAVTHLSLPSPVVQLGEQFAATDEALAELRARTEGAAFRDAASPAAAERLTELMQAVATVTGNRPLVMDRQQRRPTVMTLYSEAIEAAYLFMGALGAGVDAQLSLENRAVVQLGRWREMMSQIDAVVVGAHAEGAFDPIEPHYLHQLIGARRAMPGSFAPDLPETVRERYEELVASPPMVALERLDEHLVHDARAHHPVPVEMAEWRITQAEVAQAVEEFELTTAEALAAEGGRIATRVIAQMLAIGVLGLFVVVGTVLASLRMGRSLIGRLTALRDSALELAERPAARRGRPVAARRAGRRRRRGARRCGYGADEIGQVGHAFNEVQRTAVAVRGGGGAAAPRAQRGLPQHRPAQPDPAAPPAGSARPDGAADARPGRAGGPVPGRPPGHPDAPPRRGPGDPGRAAAGPGLAQPGADGRRGPRRGVRGGGLRAGQRAWMPGRRGVRSGGRRRHPPARRADGERHDRSPRRTPRCGSAARWSPTASRWRSRTAASA